MREYYQAHKEICKARVKRYKQANPEKVQQWNKEHDKRRLDLVKARQERNHKRHYHERKGRIREGFLKRTYGITTVEYEALVAKQNGLCAICNQLPARDLRLAIDHDHITGKIRALLCNDCNLVLGHVENNIDLLPAMLDYLDTHCAN